MHERLRCWVASQHRLEMKCRLREPTAVYETISVVLEEPIYSPSCVNCSASGQQEGPIEDVLGQKSSKHLGTLDGILSAEDSA